MIPRIMLWVITPMAQIVIPKIMVVGHYTDGQHRDPKDHVCSH